MKMRTFAKVALFGCLALVLLFFGSAFLSALFETASTLREKPGETAAGSTIPAGKRTDGPSLRLDVQVNTDGTLTVTETLSMPTLEKKLPAGGGYTRTLYKPERVDSNEERNTPPSRGFTLEFLGATCDGVSVPHHVHDGDASIRFCVDPPADSDPNDSHVYAITYTTTNGLYFPFWKRSEWLVYTALYNAYEVPIEEVLVRIEFPEDVVLSLKRVDAWTGRGHQDRWIDLEDWRGNTSDYEVVLDAPNVVSLRTTSPLYDSESFVFRVYFPRGTVDAPFNRPLYLVKVFGWSLAVLFAFTFLSFLYYQFVEYPRSQRNPSDRPERSADSKAGTAPAEKRDRPAVHPRRASRTRAVLGCAIPAFIVLFGALVVYELTIHSLVRWHEGRSWQETPCRIVELGHALRYEYEWEGRTYSSGQYDLGPFGWGVEENFQRIKAESPVGSESVCYVNPADPSQAVLSHKLKPGYFFGLAAGGFIFLIGLALFAGVRAWLRPG